jgi:hypothetical protein
MAAKTCSVFRLGNGRGAKMLSKAISKDSNERFVLYTAEGTPYFAKVVGDSHQSEGVDLSVLIQPLLPSLVDVDLLQPW